MAPSVAMALILGSLVALAVLLRRWLGRGRLYRIIFEADTPAGKGFDVVLLLAIVASVLSVVLESDPRLRVRYMVPFGILEWGFTLLFGLEYVLRLLCVGQPLRYATSFYGVVDLVAILPTFLGLILPGSQSFLVVRILRLLRVFRILKLGEYLKESELLWQALVASRRKILVFLLTIITLVIVIGALMFLIEGEAGGFVSIPVGIYWAVVTITTVGYGDVAPVTPLGRFVASAVMLLGYSIIAVPTGILSVGLRDAHRQRRQSGRVCRRCDCTDHDSDARFCKSCGAGL
ncbi:ion transporter [Synechococcus sp. BSF8S]|uniref:ion transporter n=1 Tax=Synechococcales TaxID=1890424 RepID=UPI0016271967|nr:MULTISPECIES: ion transporter [unclassified Synechococcus]MBC1259836.1 ion transporter [Synechococcus sp. BSF8S]MBC1262741.1 ion transporter [Synechococcus sp. BSA11S]